jgi:hypothetical protein
LPWRFDGKYAADGPVFLPAGCRAEKLDVQPLFVVKKNLFYIKSLTNRRLSITYAFIFAV